MIESLSLQEVAAALASDEKLPALEITGVSIDSRSVRPGHLFAALPGRRVDGHDYVEAARQAGAVAALVTRPIDSSLPQLRVPDVRTAIAQLASINRDRFTGTVIAVTGSAGKTTCKEMIAGILAGCGPVLATQGNRNNELGLPLTLLEMASDHEYAVLEMGAGRLGDIAWLCRWARPHIALVTNAQPAHLSGFGSLDAVARGKGELYEAVADGGVAVMQVDAPFAALWRGLAGNARVLTYGFGAGAADVCADNIESTEDGQRFTLMLPGADAEINLPLLGKHNILNACAAAAVAFSAGADTESICTGLSRARAVSGRLVSRRDLQGRLLIDDSYNANPGAVHAAIDVLATRPGPRALILGEMAELGADSAAFHEEVGLYASSQGIEHLWVMGDFAADVARGFGKGARVFDDRIEMVAELRNLDVGVLLVKGSRSAGMERVVSALCDGFGEEEVD